MMRLIYFSFNFSQLCVSKKKITVALCKTLLGLSPKPSPQLVSNYLKQDKQCGLSNVDIHLIQGV